MVRIIIHFNCNDYPQNYPRLLSARAVRIFLFHSPSTDSTWSWSTGDYGALHGKRNNHFHIFSLLCRPFACDFVCVEIFSFFSLVILRYAIALRCFEMARNRRHSEHTYKRKSRLIIINSLLTLILLVWRALDPTLRQQMSFFFVRASHTRHWIIVHHKYL